MRATAHPSPTERLHREDQPGSLDHASGEVDEVEASIVAGADGEPLDEVDDEALDERGARRGQAARGGRTGRRRARPPKAAGALASSTSFARPGPSSSACSGRTAVRSAQATAVVLGFVVVAGAFLGLADALAQTPRRLHPLKRKAQCSAGTSSTPTQDTRTRSSRISSTGSCPWARSATCARSSFPPRRCPR